MQALCRAVIADASSALHKQIERGCDVEIATTHDGHLIFPKKARE